MLHMEGRRVCDHWMMSGVFGRVHALRVSLHVHAHERVATHAYARRKVEDHGYNLIRL